MDLHNHVLPGLDDGPVDVAASTTLVGALSTIGFTELYPTPHQKEGSWAPTADEAGHAADQLRAALVAAGSSARIHDPGGENMWDGLFLERQASAAFPTYPGGKAFLLELPPDSIPAAVGERLFQLRLGGRLPVIAHVERYAEVARDPRRAEALGRSAALLVNLGALGGQGGWGLRRLARKLVRAQLVHAVATDAHGLDDAAFCAAGIEWIRDDLGEDGASFLLADNPRRIVAGELPEW